MALKIEESYEWITDSIDIIFELYNGVMVRETKSMVNAEVNPECNWWQ